MKLPKPFTIYDLRFTIGEKSKTRVASVSNRQSAIGNRQSEKGMALVITLIMLSVTLVMAIAFLALARRERGAVSTVTDTTTARLAADSALAAAQSQIMANLLNTNTLPTLNNGLYNFGLVVSTNYINDFGFNPNGGGNPTNVNYNYTSDGSPYTADDFIQNIANLQFLPRVPVFIVTNTQTGSNDFRFYLDLNRNGQFEDSGLINETNRAGLATGNIIPEVGDSQWIGVLARPDTTHSANNQFVSRFAFFAMPVGNGLDINAIHNQTATGPNNASLTNAASNGFFRNQGVGSWEINLAAFLADLNTNQWNTITSPYQYNEPVNGFANSGVAFDDALSILSYRYGGNYNTLASANNYFLPLRAADVFPHDNIDGYSDGPPQKTTVNIDEAFNGPTDGDSHTAYPWAGADNLNHFFDLPSELFDPTKTSGGATGGFTNRLINAGNGISTYDRYTFSRMLSQLGTDSDPDAGKMNLNYSNVLVNYDNYGVVTNMTLIPGAETNLVPWTATNFFMVAADRMLRFYTTNWFAANPSNYLATYYGVTNLYRYVNANNDLITNDPTGFGLTNFTFGGVAGDGFLNLTNQIPSFGITNIPVYVNGRFVYSSAVNRVLQLAANLYDASTTNFYPSVFKPIFQHDGLGNVFIVGYQQVDNVSSINGPQTWPAYDVASLPNSSLGLPIVDLNGQVNIYGVPWIIGAKKYLPGFNQFSMVNSAQVERLLQLSREFVGGPVWTNHMYLMTITNSLGASFWNSYANNYPTNYGGSLNLIASVSDTVQLVLTNSDHSGNPSSIMFTTNFTFKPSFWPGSHWATNGGGIPNAGSFFATNWVNNALPSMVYKTGAKQFYNTNDSDLWETNNHSCDPLPQFGLMTTNWVQAYIWDNGHVIDYVHLRGPIDNTNLTAALNDPPIEGPPNYYLWVTNGFPNGGVAPSWGIVDQISISTGVGVPPANARWNNPTTPSIPNLDSKTAAQAFFATMITPTNLPASGGGNSELTVQAGYTAVRTVFVPYLYQVNDPLVHYLASDLNVDKAGVWLGGAVTPNASWQQVDGVVAQPLPNPPGFNETVKSRYQPWGKVAPTPALLAQTYNFGNAYNLMYKDPLIWGSDNWDFPTNVYPAVGWLGRVHRGTPWQTVYLKARNVLHDIPAGDSIDAGTNTWSAWIGDANLFDSANSVPLADRMLFDLFTTRFNDNAAHGTLSVNVGAGGSDPAAGLAAWSALFSGMVVLTNTAVLAPNINQAGAASQPLPTYAAMIISPAGVNGLNSSLGNLVTNINNARTNFVNADGIKGSFEHIGDILSTLALTEQSPFLSWTNPNPLYPKIQNQQKIGISDEAYEWLPQQMMGLVRVDHAPRYVVYGYGQALRPAPNGLVTGSSNFGLVTNYQVVAESAVRAIVSVQRNVTNSATGPVTNYTTKVESYTVLPPN